MNEALQLACKNPDATMALAGGAYFVWTTIIRPRIPQSTIDKLGLVGKAVEALTGNTGHCKNASCVTDSQNKVTPR